MQLSKLAKIALILGILLILAVILVLWINKKNSQNTTDLSAEPTSSAYAPSATALSSDESVTPGESATETSSDQINYISVTPTVSVSASATSTKIVARTPVSTVDANGIRTYTVAVTPAPNAGPLDWTVTNKTMTVMDASGSPLAGKTMCEIAGFSDDWSNFFDKMSCDLTNFFDQKIFAPLLELTCAMTASGIQSNINSNVTYEFKDGACLIIDRK